jgi:diguanylate cyclase (GGDEF)-like protein
MFTGDTKTSENAKSSSVLAGTRHLRHFPHQLLFSILICIPLWLLSPLERLDVFWSDVILARQVARMPSNIVVINVTPEDVIAHGMERLSRKYFAATLTLLAEAKVKRVLIDFNMARMSTPEEEAEVLDALKLFGPSRIGFAYESTSELRPGQILLSEASVVNLSLNPDYDGRIRSIEASKSLKVPNPCIWMASGEKSYNSSAIDLRYDPRSIRRVSLSELHAGKIPIEQLENCLAIISLNRELSRTRATLPLYGPTDRGAVLAMGTASTLTGYSTSFEQKLKLLSMLPAVLTLASVYVGYKTANITNVFLGLFRLITLAMVVSWFGTYFGGIPTKPAANIMTSIAVISLSLAHRLKVFELFKGLLSGVLSPEEVWLWRTYSDRNTPAILFDAMGYIKKANPAALVEFQLKQKDLHQSVSELAKKCMPSLGERCNRLVFAKEARKVWDVEWPCKHLPIAIFTDVTDQHEELEGLQFQLTTDPLTGALNRRGFELTLQKIDDQQTRDFTVFFMDMNGFKAVNDRYGHAAGDTLLRVAAQRFRDVMSQHDYVTRFGGDEFAIIVPRRLSMEDAISIRDRIESTMYEKIDVGSVLVQVGVAAGFAIPINEHETRESILDRADHDMYERKNFLKSEQKAVNTSSGRSISISFVG